MRYRLFGRSGLRVSELSLGAMTFGDAWGWGAAPEESRAIFDAYCEAGGNFIDTAHIYTDGASERMVGEFVRADRDHFVIATKYSSAAGPDLVNAGNNRKTMMRHVEESLRRLGADHIDLYFVHAWDFTTPIDEVMRGLDDLVAQGKVHYVAASNMPAWQVSRGNMLADLRGWSAFAGVQIEYSLAERTAERDLLPMAAELDLGVMGWSPLAAGLLTGKHLAGDAPGARRRADQMPARTRRIAEVVVKVAGEIGRSPSQVAIAFVRAQRSLRDIIPILGARTRDQLMDNLGCLDLVLDEPHLAELREVSAIELGYPHAALGSELMRNFAFAGQADRIDLPPGRRPPRA